MGWVTRTMRLSGGWMDDRALVLTTDFFTPVVDDPYDYGAIAAANALSDVYAMGGKPFLALNIAALPPALPAEMIGEILRGGAEIARQAGVVIAGGHTIQDQEPKYGLVVLGFVDPRRMLTKGGAQPGDVLVLSKPLGFGTTTTALKRGVASPADVAEVVGWMKRLNKTASELGLAFGAARRHGYHRLQPAGARAGDGAGLWGGAAAALCRSAFCERGAWLCPGVHLPRRRVRQPAVLWPGGAV